MNSLLNFSRTSPAEFGEVDINRVLEETLSLVRHQLDKARVHTELKFGSEPLVVNGNAGKLQQVFLNLFLNARDAMDGGGTLTIRTWNDGAYARIEIQTPGRASRRTSASHLRSVLHHQGGTEGHRARLIGHLRHRPGAWRRDRSAERTRRWYTVPSGVPSVQKTGECLIPRLHEGKILVIDDEADIRESLETLLDMEGYTVDLPSMAARASRN